MKTILVDAINAFVIKEEGINQAMQTMLEEFPNPKIILTGANDEQREKFGLNDMPYEVFTLKHDPEKTDPSYYKKMLEHFHLKADQVIYFEHDAEAVESARSVGINTYHYNKDARDIGALKQFIQDNI